MRLLKENPLSDLLGYAGRGALVVGGGQGIGRATSLALSSAGAAVAVLDVELQRAESVAAELRAAGGEGVALSADVTDAPAAEAAVAHAAEALGGIDHLVNIVGGASWAPLLEMDDATWERDFEVNLKHHWAVSRAGVRAMEGEGSIVAIASISGAFSSAGHGAYGAAKAGLIGLVRTMAEEWWSLGVRVNAVVPGAVRTPRIEAAWEDGTIPQPVPDTLERMALPEDIAGAVVFLGSALARRITGQSIVVDGGATTRFPYDVGGR